MILESLTISADELAAGTGWLAKPEGLCKGDICVPAPEATLPGGALDVNIVADRLGMPLVHDANAHRWALGPATLTGKALTSAALPDLVLQDDKGQPFSFASLRGRRTIMVAWASW